MTLAVLNLDTPRLDLYGTDKDLTGHFPEWNFENNEKLGDRFFVMVQGNNIVGSAIRIVGHAFVLNLGTGGFVWSYSDDTGPKSYRFQCRQFS